MCRSLTSRFTATGQVIDANGYPLPNVAVMMNNGLTATLTNAAGYYTVTGLLTGTYTLIPQLGGYVFTPTQRVTSVPPNAADLNFTGQLASTGLPPQPLAITAQPGYASIALNWTVSNRPEVSAYRLSRAISGTGTFVPIATLSGTAYLDSSSLITGTTYCYQVAGLNSSQTVIVGSNTACAMVGSLDIWVADVWAATGTTATIPINIRNAAGLRIGSADIWLDYDPAVLTPVGVVNTALTTQYQWQSGIQDLGGLKRLKIATLSANPPMLYGAGSLFWITVQVNGPNGATSLLDLREYINGVGGSSIQDPAYQDIPLTFTDGTFNVGNAYVLGDVNGNGVIQAVDALMALDIAAGRLTPTWEQRMASDVNGNGTVDVADAAMILYYAAHGSWPRPGQPLAAAPDLPTSNPIIKLKDVIGQPGSSVTVAVNGANLSSWSGGDITIVYDRAYVAAITQVELGQAAVSFNLAYFDDDAGRLHIALANGSPVVGDGVLARITLQVAANALPGTSTPLNLASADLSDEYGRDFATSALQKPVIRESATLTLSQYQVYLPLVQR